MIDSLYIIGDFFNVLFQILDKTNSMIDSNDGSLVVDPCKGVSCVNSLPSDVKVTRHVLLIRVNDDASVIKAYQW